MCYLIETLAVPFAAKILAIDRQFSKTFDVTMRRPGGSISTVAAARAALIIPRMSLNGVEVIGR